MTYLADLARPARQGAYAPAVTQRDIKKRDKLIRIADAARFLFGKRGFADTTIKQIAARAGVATGTIFRYVSCKEDLLTLAFSREFEEVATRAYESAKPSDPIAEQIGTFFVTFFDFHGSDASLSRETLREVGFLRNPQRDFGLSEVPVIDKIVIILRRAVDRNELSADKDLRIVAHGFMALYWWSLREWINEGSPRESSIALMRQLILLFLDGVSSDKKLAAPSAG